MTGACCQSRRESRREQDRSGGRAVLHREAGICSVISQEPDLNSSAVVWS